MSIRILNLGAQEVIPKGWFCPGCGGQLEPEMRVSHIKGTNHLFLNCENPDCGEELEVKLPKSPSEHPEYLDAGYLGAKAG